jgi:ankyrin repeat protein
MTAAEVLRRYKEEELPAFAEISLEDVNQIGNFGERPLHVACARGNMEEIAALIEAGADVNAPGDMGNTPLHECVGQGHHPAIQFLLDHGASPYSKNEFGESAIDTANLKGRADIIRLLTQSRRS